MPTTIPLINTSGFDKLKLLSEELKQIIEEFNIKKIDIRIPVVPNNNNTISIKLYILQPI